MRRSALVVVLVVAAACSGSGASDQVVAVPSTTATSAPSIVLPVLPEHGMAVQRGDDHVVLTDAGGAVVHELPQHYVDDRSAPGSIYLWRSGEVSGGRALRLDAAAHALDPIVVREPSPVSAPGALDDGGSWRWLVPGPAGGAELGQWQGRCGEQAFFVEGGAARPAVAGSSAALGWLPDGRAAVAVLGDDRCGAPALQPGVHAVGVGGDATFLTEGVRGMTWGT